MEILTIHTMLLHRLKITHILPTTTARQTTTISHHLDISHKQFNRLPHMDTPHCEHFSLSSLEFMFGLELKRIIILGLILI